MTERARVHVPLASREALREAIREDEAGAGLFVAGEHDVAVGEEVQLEILIEDEGLRFRLRGQVRWRRARRPGARRDVPPGLGVELLPGDLAGRRFLADLAAGEEMALGKRAGTRHDVGVPVRVRDEGGASHHTVTEDLSAGGAFLASDAQVEVGRRLRLKLLPPGALFGIGVEAVVAWRREEGERGFGVEFVFDSKKRRSRVQRAVERLQALARERAAARRRR